MSLEEELETQISKVRLSEEEELEKSVSDMLKYADAIMIS